jgi:hypothetical protein
MDGLLFLDCTFEEIGGQYSRLHRISVLLTGENRSLPTSAAREPSIPANGAVKPGGIARLGGITYCDVGKPLMTAALAISKLITGTNDVPDDVGPAGQNGRSQARWNP